MIVKIGFMLLTISIVARGVALGANTYYVDNNKEGYKGQAAPSGACAISDADTGLAGHPWCTMAHVQNIQSKLRADDQVLFARGDTWTEVLMINGLQGTSGHPVIIGNYGTGPLPVIDGGSIRTACFSAQNVVAKYITVDGFECRNSTQYGITFQTTAGGMPGITVKNCNIHNTGAGAFPGATVGPTGADSHCATGVPIGPCDDLTYSNQLDFQDFGQGADGVRFLDNVVKTCGGHNCVQVHYDIGGPIVSGNTVGPGCPHNCLDVKGIAGSGASVDRNVVTTGHPTGGAAAYYSENTAHPASVFAFNRNVAYNSGIGLQVEAGGDCIHGECSITVRGYNNTIYSNAASANPFIDTSCIGGKGVDGGVGGGAHTLDLRNNIVDGGSVNIHSNCIVTWDYNDDGGRQGLFSTNVAAGPHDLTAVDPLYVNYAAVPPDLHLTASSPVRNKAMTNLVPNLVDLGAFSYFLAQ
jgi:hypothetical protein